MGSLQFLSFLLLTTVFINQAMDGGSVNAEANPQKLSPQTTLLEPPQLQLKSIADPPEAGSDERRNSEAEAPESAKMERHRSSSDKSVAGGGVIIGGLVTAIFAAVYCYIRVTRRRRTATNDLIV